jgi:hypothetical protein
MQDGEGWLNYGPYISLPPASYRATFRYVYLSPPAADKMPIYDLFMHRGDLGESLHATPLPCPNANPQIFTDDFTVTQPHQQFEMRIFYHGSGTIRLDSLDVTYRGP